MTRRLFVTTTVAAAAAAGPNIRWGLGIVTWTNRAGREKRPLDLPIVIRDGA